MACKIFLVVYCILQILAFLFILVGTPIDQFRSKNQDSLGNTNCLTFWGTKTKCYSTEYNGRVTTIFRTCDGRKTRFQAAQAFSIISIGVFLAAALMGLIQLCCCACFRWICLLLNIVGTATACVCWACMVSEYYNSRGALCPKFNTTMKYGAGFALFVVGWVINMVNIVILMLPC